MKKSQFSMKTVGLVLAAISMNPSAFANTISSNQVTRPSAQPANIEKEQSAAVIKMLVENGSLHIDAQTGEMRLNASVLKILKDAQLTNDTYVSEKIADGSRADGTTRI